jgi:hypothetical protein
VINAKMTKLFDDDDGPPTEEEYEMRRHMRFIQIGLCIGLNELAKMSKTLDEKAYYRLMRDNAVEDLKEMGANGGVSPFAEDEYVLEFDVPDVRPKLRFRESDIEAMRLTVARYDVSKAEVDQS